MLLCSLFVPSFSYSSEGCDSAVEWTILLQNNVQFSTVLIEEVEKGR